MVASVDEVRNVGWSGWRAASRCRADSGTSARTSRPRRHKRRMAPPLWRIVTGGRTDVCVGRSKGDKQKSDQPDPDVDRLIVHRKVRMPGVDPKSVLI